MDQGSIYWKSLGILSVLKSGNHGSESVLYMASRNQTVSHVKTVP